MCSAPGLETKNVAFTVCYSTYAHLKGCLSHQCRRIRSVTTSRLVPVTPFGQSDQHAAAPHGAQSERSCSLGARRGTFSDLLPAVVQVPSRATLRRPGLNATPDVLCFGAKKLVSTSSMTMVPAQHMQNAHTPKMSVRQGTLHTWYACSRHGKPPQANRSLVVTLAPIRVALPEEYYSVCAALQRNRGGRPS